jgi:hypothetical protein
LSPRTLIISVFVLLSATRLAAAQDAGVHQEDELDVRAAPTSPGESSARPSAPIPPPANGAPSGLATLPPPPKGEAGTTATDAATVATAAEEVGRQPAADWTDSPWGRPVPYGFAVSGYLQLQYQQSQLSEDELQQGGSPLNQDRFLVRRARLRIDRGWQFAAATLEVDGNYARGPSFGLRRAEGTLVYRAEDPKRPPLAALTLGLFDIPFGYELADSSRVRYFMERSLASLAFFPSEPEIGLRIAGAIGFARYSLALVNGEPLDGATGRFPTDPNAAKDILGRFGVEASPNDNLRIAGGMSFLHGKGFHAGSGASKDSTAWRDIDENGVVDTGEVSGVPGVAATPSANFRRWAFGADLELRWRTKLGWSALYGEAYVASNLDRGLFVADPLLASIDSREVGYYGAILQELGPYALVGLRVDVYDPNSDFLYQRAGKFLPATQRMRTYSPLIGLELPNQAKLLFQYDFIDDRLGKNASGVPADLDNNQWTLRLQVLL